MSCMQYIFYRLVVMYSVQRQSRMLNTPPRPRGRTTATECSSVSVANLPTTFSTHSNCSAAIHRCWRVHAPPLLQVHAMMHLYVHQVIEYPCQNPASHPLSPPTNVYLLKCVRLDFIHLHSELKENLNQWDSIIEITAHFYFRVDGRCHCSFK